MSKYITEKTQNGTLIKNEAGVTLARCFKESFAEKAVDALNERSKQAESIKEKLEEKKVTDSEDSGNEELADRDVTGYPDEDSEEYKDGVDPEEVEEPSDVKESQVENGI